MERRRPSCARPLPLSGTDSWRSSATGMPSLRSSSRSAKSVSDHGSPALMSGKSAGGFLRILNMSKNISQAFLESESPPSAGFGLPAAPDGRRRHAVAHFLARPMHARRAHQGYG